MMTQTEDKLYYPGLVPPKPICRPSPDGRHQFSPPSINCDYCGFGGVIVNDVDTGELKVLYVPTELGMQYHQSEAKHLMLWGGRGSAKSTTGRWDAHMRALAFPGFKYIILRRTFPELENSHLAFIQGEMRALGGHYNQTSHKAYYPNGSVGTFSHCATSEDVLKLLSSEFALAFFDEISTFEWEMFTKLKPSVRVPVGTPYKAFVRAATNPLGPSAQKLNEYFVDKNVDFDEDPLYNPNEWVSIKANVEDNPYLDRAEYLKQFAGLPDHIRRAWIDGEFIFEHGIFNLEYTRRDVDGIKKPWHVVHDLDFPRLLSRATVYRAIDAGWFPDPTVILWVAHLGNRHVFFHEKTLYRTTALDTAEIIKQEDAKIARRIDPTGKFQLRVPVTYCDPSMDINTTADIRTIKEIYEDNGVPLENSINSREFFASSMQQALAEEAGEWSPRVQFYVNKGDAELPGCQMLVRTIPQMRYHPKHFDRMDDHKDDHWVVAACYYLMSHSSDLRKEWSPMQNLPKWMRPKLKKKTPLDS